MNEPDSPRDETHTCPNCGIHFVLADDYRSLERRLQAVQYDLKLHIEDLRVMTAERDAALRELAEAQREIAKYADGVRCPNCDVLRLQIDEIRAALAEKGKP